MSKNVITETRPEAEGNTQPLTKVQIQAAQLLAAGQPIKKTARICGTTRQSLWRWTNRVPAFQHLLSELESEAIQEARKILVGHAKHAAAVLVRSLAQTNDPKLQVKAAVEILDRSVGDPSRTEITIGQSQQQGPPEYYSEYLEWRATQREGPSNDWPDRE